MSDAIREPEAEWVEMPPSKDARGRVWRDFACSACHCKWDVPEDREPPAACPFCGAVMR